MNGIVTQTISSLVLPWMGAPSERSPGLARKMQDRVDRHGHHQHEDRHRGHHAARPTAGRCRRPPWRPGAGTSRSTARSRCPRWWPPGSPRPCPAWAAYGIGARLSLDPITARDSISVGRRARRDHPRASRLAPMDLCRRLGRERLAAHAAEARRRSAVVAPKRLGELGGLAVSHCASHLVHRRAALPEQFGRSFHPDPLEVGAKARLACLGEGALELAARGDHAPGDVVEVHAAGVFLVDDARRRPGRARGGAGRWRVAWLPEASLPTLRTGRQNGSHRFARGRATRRRRCHARASGRAREGAARCRGGCLAPSARCPRR